MIKLLRKYAIKNKMGLWYDGSYYFDRGLTKAGKPRKTGPTILRSSLRSEHPVLFTKEMFDYHIQKAVREGRKDLFEDTEIVAFQYKECKTTLRIDAVRERAEAKEIIRKLKV